MQVKEKETDRQTETQRERRWVVVAATNLRSSRMEGGGGVVVGNGGVRWG